MDKEPKEGLDWKDIEAGFYEKVTNRPNAYSPNNKRLSDVDYRAVLEQASKSMIRFKRPEHLIRQIVHMIDKEVGTTHTAALLYKENKNSYVLIDSKGAQGKKIPVGYIRLIADNPLISIFTRKEFAPLLNKSGALVYDFVKQKLADRNFLDQNPQLIKKLESAKKQMDLLQADICVPSYFKKRLLGVLILGNKLSGRQFTREEIGFFITLANDTAMALSNAQLIENLQEKIKEVETLYEKSHKLFIHTSIALAAAIDARDPYTHGHTERVTAYSLAIAEELRHEDFPEIRTIKNFRESLHIAALLHDIGKIGIPDHILKKNGTLTTEEFEKVKEHPVIGATILYPIKELGIILSGVRSHQERYDGTGYPDRLKGNEIPLLARIIAVADAFDAITTNRPYRNKKTIEDALIEIRRSSGTQFDPQIVEAFFRAYEKRQFFNFV